MPKARRFLYANPPAYRGYPQIVEEKGHDVSAGSRELTNSKLTIPKKKEHNDMCKALDDLGQDGRKEGKKEGRTEEREKSTFATGRKYSVSHTSMSKSRRFH